jgi:hypothetical protein
MKQEYIKFLKNFIVFFCLVIFVISAANFLYINLIEYHSIYWRKKFDFKEFVKTQKNIKYAFFGTSRTQDAINPQFIPESYNFSLPSQTYVVAFYRLKNLLENYNLKIENIIFEIDFNSLSDHLGNTEVLANFDMASEIPLNVISELNNKTRTEMWVKTSFPFLGKGFLTYGFLRYPKSELYRGWAKWDNNYEPGKTDFNENLKTGFLQHTMVDKTAFNYFIKTLELARENGINIYIYKNPFAKELDDAFKNQKIDLTNFYKSIYDELDKSNIKYAVLDHYSTFFNHPEYFQYDGGHLNYKGAEAISKIIGNELEKKSQLSSK